jgi:hypothetical protein
MLITRIGTYLGNLGHRNVPFVKVHTGLGIDLNSDALERFPYRSWHRPFPLRPDGSLSYQ